MPLDPQSGVFYSLHGPQDGVPLLIGLPLFASFEQIFGAVMKPVLDGYLERLVDRYRVLLLDYPSIGGSRDVPPGQLTADRVCADILSVADAAGFRRFAYWGYSWGGGVALQLARRTQRLTALVMGGWPPLEAPVAALLQAARIKLPQPDAGSMKVLRNAAQYAQWITYSESILDWPEADCVSRIRCPRMVYFGSDGDLVEAGVPIPIASLVRKHRPKPHAQGWKVLEIEGEGHGVCLKPERVVPGVRPFLDANLEQ